MLLYSKKRGIVMNIESNEEFHEEMDIEIDEEIEEGVDAAIDMEDEEREEEVDTATDIEVDEEMEVEVNTVMYKENIATIYGDGLIIDPRNKQDKYIYGQKTITLLEQKHLMDMLWAKYLVRLRGNEYKVLFFILARTFGYNKLREIIRIKDIKNGVVSKKGEILQYGTGLSESSIKRALKSLSNHKYIIRVARWSQNDGSRLTTCYFLNIDFFNQEVLNSCYGGNYNPDTVRLSSSVKKKTTFKSKS
jgi:hypothetical protein